MTGNTLIPTAVDEVTSLSGSGALPYSPYNNCNIQHLQHTTSACTEVPRKTNHHGHHHVAETLEYPWCRARL